MTDVWVHSKLIVQALTRLPLFRKVNKKDYHNGPQPPQRRWPGIQWVPPTLYISDTPSARAFSAWGTSLSARHVSL